MSIGAWSTCFRRGDTVVNFFRYKGRLFCPPCLEQIKVQVKRIRECFEARGVTLPDTVDADLVNGFLILRQVLGYCGDDPDLAASLLHDVITATGL